MLQCADHICPSGYHVGICDQLKSDPLFSCTCLLLCHEQCVLLWASSLGVEVTNLNQESNKLAWD
jgi:hypothetical protein